MWNRREESKGKKKKREESETLKATSVENVG